jgi:CheY-like chemotaxis protein
MNSGEALFSDGGPKPAFPPRQSPDGEVSLTAGKRALIVEDEIMVAWHLESVLEDLEMEVCGLASNAPEAVTEAVKDNVDIVFMDVNLAGEMDGIEAARRIRERRDVPIIFVTAYAADDATISRIVSALGPSVIVGKPATPASIRQALLRLREI